MPAVLSKPDRGGVRRWQVYLAEGEVGDYTRSYVGCVEVYDEETTDEAVERRRKAHQAGMAAGGAVWLSLCEGAIRIRKLGPALYKTARISGMPGRLVQLIEKKGWRIKP